ncbi:hypothetical protein B0J14DRAFT_587765 [Halenospora varia]|nr:hypothetical protein B0J14DRAFT_587765 [Halenospora varia]
MAEILFDAATAQPVQPRSCDQCTFRKLKCNRHKPCARCIDKSFDCTYLKPTQRRGLSSRRLSEIFQTPSHSNTATSLGFQSPRLDEAEQTSFLDLDSHGQIHTGHVGLTDNILWADDQSLLGNFSNFSSGPSINQTIPTPTAEASQFDTFDWSAGVLEHPGLSGDSFYHASESIRSPTLSTQVQQQSLVPRASLSDTQVWQTSSCPEVYEWPTTLDDSTLLPTIETFDKRIYSTIPVFSRKYLMKKLLAKQHLTNCTFGAMVIALHAFILVQPIQTDERCLIFDRMRQAEVQMEEALRMRNVGGAFGQASSVEAVMTSFFLFGCQFGRGQDNAAWLRLREAISLGELMGLHDSSSYVGLDAEEKERRIRTYWLLSVTERAYAIQKRHSINFVGKVSASLNFFQLELEPELQTKSKRQESSAHGLYLMVQLFETFDESILECWNNKCQADGSACKALRPQQMASLARMLREFFIGLPFLGERETSLDIFGSSTQHGLQMLYLDDAQQADVSITQQWLRNRLWKLCCTHELLQVDHSCEELRYDLAVEIGCSTLAICEKMKLCTLEVHGLGIVEKIYDIALEVLRLIPLPHSGEMVAPRLGVGSYTAVAVATSASSVGFKTPMLSTSFQQSHSGTSHTFIYQLANRFLAFFALFRGGLHPYLSLYMKELAQKEPVKDVYSI